MLREKGKGIRMFKTRLLSGIVLVILALATILMGGAVLCGVLLIISVIAFFELCKTAGIHTEGKRGNGIEILGSLAIVLYYGAVFFGRTQTYVMLMVLLTLMAFMFLYVAAFPKFKAEQIMAAVFSFIYAPVMLSYLYQTRALENGNYIVWMILLCSWGCDTCAYCVGVLIGKHKFAPRLSPKKSIEGAVGGVAGAAVLGALYAYFIVEKVIPGQNITVIFAVIGAAGAVISQIGDLAASGIKRDHGIKDYGKLIPGHGGIMDRFDSVIFTAPVIYFLALLMISQ